MFRLELFYVDTNPLWSWFCSNELLTYKPIQNYTEAIQKELPKKKKSSAFLTRASWLKTVNNSLCQRYCTPSPVNDVREWQRWKAPTQYPRTPQKSHLFFSMAWQTNAPSTKWPVTSDEDFNSFSRYIKLSVPAKLCFQEVCARLPGKKTVRSEARVRIKCKTGELLDFKGFAWRNSTPQMETGNEDLAPRRQSAVIIFDSTPEKSR